MTEKEEKLVTGVKNKYVFAKNYKDNKDFDSNQDKWEDYYNGTSTELKEREDRGLSAIMPAWAQAGVDYVLAKEIAVIFGQRPYWSVGALAKKWEEAAKIATERLTFLLDSPKTFLNVIQRIQDKLVFGTSIIKPCWDRQDRESKLEPIDNKNFFPSPDGYSIYETPWVIQRSLRTRKYIEAMGRPWRGSRKSTYKNTAELLKNKGGQYIGEINEETTRWTTEEKENIYEILEYWDRRENKVITIGERRVLLRDIENPYKKKKGLPFIVMVDFPKPKSFWGIGRIAAIELHIRELAHIKNQRFDNINLILNPPYKYVKGMDVDLDVLPISPNALIGMDDITALQAIEFPFVTGSVYQESNEIEKEIQNRLGIHEYWMGRAPEQRETASGIARLQAAGNTMFQFINMLSLVLGMKEIAAWITAIDQQYFKESISLPWLYDVDRRGEYLTVTNSRLQGNFYFTPKVAPLHPETIKDVERGQFITAVQTATALQANLKRQQLARVLFEKFDIPEEDIEKIIPPETEVPGAGAMPPQPGGAGGPRELGQEISAAVGRAMPGTPPSPRPER
jgi:hypothetical protein